MTIPILLLSKSNILIHTVLNSCTITYNRQLATCLSTPCLTLLLNRRRAITAVCRENTWLGSRAERVIYKSRCHTERTPAEALNSLQFAYPERLTMWERTLFCIFFWFILSVSTRLLIYICFSELVCLFVFFFVGETHRYCVIHSLMHENKYPMMRNFV